MSAAIEGINRNRFTTEAADSGVGTQLLNDPFPTVRTRLAEMMMANISLCIDEIEHQPIFALESASYRIVVIDGDGIIDSHGRFGAANVVDIIFNANSGACTPITTSP